MSLATTALNLPLQNAPTLARQPAAIPSDARGASTRSLISSRIGRDGPDVAPACRWHGGAPAATGFPVLPDLGSREVVDPVLCYTLRTRMTSAIACSSHGDDDLAPSVAFLDVADGSRDFAERVNPVDGGCHCSGLDEVSKDRKVCGILRRHQ